MHTGIACISASNPLDQSVSHFPETMRIAADVASGFSVQYYNHFKVATTSCGKHQPSGA